MRIWRTRWNNLEVPENWNVSCLSLLLDADQAYLEQNQAVPSAVESSLQAKRLLPQNDRELFERLVSYKMLELNLKTTLIARIGWKPEKTTMPIGPLAICRSCLYPRSVTMMGKKDMCGNCLATDYKDDEERKQWIEGRVSKDTSETSDATWVECFNKECRAQYIVYHPEALNVRPKCYYCRAQSSHPKSKGRGDPAPMIECSQCLSRVIYPHKYRPKNMLESEYKCVGCTSGRTTVIDVETTATKLSKENSIAWLLLNKQDKLKEPLSGRSLFQQITQSGTDDFCKQVLLFPESNKQVLTLDGKLLQNTPEVISQMREWISRRRTEQGTCSLCFSSMRKSDINAACGRRGCNQLICRSCLSGWYGLNGAGRMINISALSCPFCRRAPTAKTLHAYGMGIHAIRNLGQAVERKGQWIYAWCKTCATASPYLERVCARGAPPELSDWSCDECQRAEALAAQRHAEWIAAETARLEAEGRRIDWEARAALQARADRRAQTLKLVTKKCPHCQVETEKSMGCGHMTCICGKHWCWFCGEKQAAGDIYDHMSEVHGGWYDADDEHE